MRLVKWAVSCILLVAALAGAATAGYFYILHPRRRPAPDVRAPRSPDAVERGRYLAHHVAGCMSCHSASSFYEPGDPIDPRKPVGSSGPALRGRACVHCAVNGAGSWTARQSST